VVRLVLRTGTIPVPHGSVVTKTKYFAVEILTQYLVTEGAFLIIPREKWGNSGSTSPHSLDVQKYKIEHDVVRLVLRPGTIPYHMGQL
jgi:hypothetical protein